MWEENGETSIVPWMTLHQNFFKRWSWIWDYIYNLGKKEGLNRKGNKDNDFHNEEEERSAKRRLTTANWLVSKLKGLQGHLRDRRPSQAATISLLSIAAFHRGCDPPLHAVYSGG